MVETVNHPSHYGGDTPYEVIKVLEAWLTPEMFKGFLLGNVIKYQARAHLKGTESEDHRKALRYQNYLVKWEDRRANSVIKATILTGNKETVDERCVPRYDDNYPMERK